MSTAGRVFRPAMQTPLRIFLHTCIVTALNPKSIIFFVAFLPQFLNAAQPLLPQMVVLETTFLVLAIVMPASKR